MHDFLDLVEDGLLVVKKNNKQILDRFDIHQVHRELITMLHHCWSNEYVIKPVAL